MIAAALSAEEKQAIARYYGSMPYRQMVRVVETDEAPQVRSSRNGLMLPLEDLPWVPLGMRIVEVPEHPEHTEIQRDPRGKFVAYAPRGSLAAGRNWWKGVAAGRFSAASAMAPVSGRRRYSQHCRAHGQLYDAPAMGRQAGFPGEPIMAPILINLTAEDMLYISAYLASLPP